MGGSRKALILAGLAAGCFCLASCDDQGEWRRNAQVQAWERFFSLTTVSVRYEVGGWPLIDGQHALKDQFDPQTLVCTGGGRCLSLVLPYEDPNNCKDGLLIVDDFDSAAYYYDRNTHWSDQLAYEVTEGLVHDTVWLNSHTAAVMLVSEKVPMVLFFGFDTKRHWTAIYDTRGDEFMMRGNAYWVARFGFCQNQTTGDPPCDGPHHQ